MERLLEMSKKVTVYCRNKLSFKDSRLDNPNEVFTCFRRTPLHIAVLSDDIKLAKKLLSLKHGLASIKDNLGWTPLHLASARASLEMVELLLTAEPAACVSIDEAQRTPLHLATMNNRVEIMKILMEEGLPEAVHVKNDQNGETILHFCVHNNTSTETFDLLVDKLSLARTSDPYILVNSKDYNGKTVLQLAAETGKTEMVHYLLESSNLKLEITEADFAEAMSALSPEIKVVLETRFLKYLGPGNKKHKSKSLSKNGDEHEGLKERVNALMVVATLIAGIAFQAAMNPPGGVWQDDIKVDSGTDPVKFGYYLDKMFIPSISGGLNKYIQDYLAYIKTDGKQYSAISNFVKSLMMDITQMELDGLILEDSAFAALVSDYNNSDGSLSFPYLIRYAGYPILAYTYPVNYVIYIVTNGVALFTSLTIIFLVVCGFMIETSVKQVRFLVLLMCISIGCIAFGYMSILQAMLPDFYIETICTFIILQVIFGVCCILGVGLFIWTLAWEVVKLRKRTRHHHIGVINYLKAIFYGMDAMAAGKLILFIVSYFALRLNGFIYYGSWSEINPFLF